MRKNRTYFFFIFTLLVLDQISKYLISKTIPVYGQVNVIPGFFNLVHIHNRGAIFGFMNRSGTMITFTLLTLASLAALVLVIYYFVKTPPSEVLLKIALSLVLAGALGNLLDRVLRGYVIDFLDIFVKKWHWASFNVADSCISIGAVLMIYAFFFKRSVICSQPSSN